ncbi:MAG: hypothetical protein IPH18_15910 [Chitinophagaceae bacterium]|nr:hypothetical protein [Chitinophagaceae bacterium]
MTVTASGGSPGYQFQLMG